MSDVEKQAPAARRRWDRMKDDPWSKRTFCPEGNSVFPSGGRDLLAAGSHWRPLRYADMKAIVRAVGL